MLLIRGLCPPHARVSLRRQTLLPAAQSTGSAFRPDTIRYAATALYAGVLTSCANCSKLCCDVAS